MLPRIFDENIFIEKKLFFASKHLFKRDRQLQAYQIKIFNLTLNLCGS